MALNDNYFDVQDFHLAFGHPAAATPTKQSVDRVTKRASWLRSEVDELEEAKTVVDQADAYMDIIYFAIGGMVELGVYPQQLWDIVHKANMAKLGPNGKPLFHPDGKTRKPDGWVAPEPLLMAEINRQSQFRANQ